ncbi:hypothetical protein CERZMDRAFT_94669 [Cercospora zeae-maydis SCOH1-5]|uniref:Uncharacterized protein n=1 Tax=Cercospora zeae-maydis SCOH1-5 TaxID=717836 RepID=A0A6A6FPA8_9PEZI|nr:hypothetical protein CERZMDRAFT_94669 [Cercospora zeae-maydis SCOH1-5]
MKQQTAPISSFLSSPSQSAAAEQAFSSPNITPAHILITYGCLHFTLVPTSTTPDQPIRRNFATLDALWEIPTTKHLPKTIYCGKPTCSLLNPRKLHARARHSLENVNAYLSSAVERYVELGTNYHTISFHARAKVFDQVSVSLHIRNSGLK